MIHWLEIYLCSIPFLSNMCVVCDRMMFEPNLIKPISIFWVRWYIHGKNTLCYDFENFFLGKCCTIICFFIVKLYSTLKMKPMVEFVFLCQNEKYENPQQKFKSKDGWHCCNPTFSEDNSWRWFLKIILKDNFWK